MPPEPRPAHEVLAEITSKYDSYRRNIKSVVRCLYADLGEATFDEMTSDVINYVRQFIKRESEAGQSIWSIHKIIRYGILTVRRQYIRNRRFTDLGQIQPADKKSDFAPDRALLRSQLRAAIVALPPDLRRTFVFREILGYSEHETAAALGVPVGTVKSRLHNAKNKLRQVLQPLWEEVQNAG